MKRNLLFPALPNMNIVNKMDKRYTFASSPIPTNGNNNNLSLVPIPTRLFHPPNLNSSPINQNSTYNSTPISYNPPEEFQSHRPPSPIPGPSQSLEKPTKKTSKKGHKPPKVLIFHHKKSSKSKKTIILKYTQLWPHTTYVVCINYQLAIHPLTHFSVVQLLFTDISLLLSNMPNRCSVANCSSNYDGTNYTPVFEMANHWSKELQDEWRRFLHRNNAWELAKVFICSKYFNDDDVLLHFDIPMVQ
ncbi:hypothetical protein LOD99_1947 [Oopsacas minuta]|uniref:THAP-type domain-containing protein n=1 Tax=Oopsacas minuta TaxID=111878 RepID=A0AAV7K4R9_9METZ|nr:hypothetical protein LOD99_1947 [Oopsacas minuta]